MQNHPTEAAFPFPSGGFLKFSQRMAKIDGFQSILALGLFGFVPFRKILRQAHNMIHGE